MYQASDLARLIPWAAFPGNSPYRTPWRRDFARVVHSPAFRRLQGKTQLFPGIESDFFRNRLTHSIEAAQIAKTIALRLNHDCGFLRRPGNSIEPDICEIAALCHDLGHPPFGHNGEKALDECMLQHGGFEGNAQTLRILARLEKRPENPAGTLSGFSADGQDHRCGLNLTARVLGSVLKYDHPIPFQREEGASLEKGYYQSEKEIVDWIKTSIVSDFDGSASFHTIECEIMDIADDIAYSTYDLEDALKAGFISPLDATAARPEIVEEVSSRVSRPSALGKEFTPAQVREVLHSVFGSVVSAANSLAAQVGGGEKDNESIFPVVNIAYETAQNLAGDGRLRCEFSSQLVGQAVEAVELIADERNPALSKVRLEESARERVEVLKNFTFVSQIMSPRLKTSEYRGGQIVKTIFDALYDHGRDGHRLLPNDFGEMYRAAGKDEHRRARVVCDFIAGMTDRYALEFYGRLRSENPQTIFKPL